MLEHIKRVDGNWTANANGHVVQDRFFREFKRKGAEVAVMSEVQFEGYFGEPERKNGEPFHHYIDGVPVISDKNIPKDQIHFHVAEKLLGKIINLYVPPEPDGETKTSS